MRKITKSSKGNTMKVYNKLVRDHIPDIIEAGGKSCVIKSVEGEELRHLLEEKLIEEFNEYLEEQNLEELADLLEVVIGLAQYHGYTEEKLMEARIQKKKERGGFEKGVFLELTT